MIVRLPLEIGAEEFMLGRWHGTLTCSSKRFHNRPVWIGAVVCLSEDAARDDARQMLNWLERQTWMGGDEGEPRPDQQSAGRHADNAPAGHLAGSEPDHLPVHPQPTEQEA